MICKLYGVVDEIFNDALSINVNGVCYFIYAPSSVLSGATCGDNISIIIHHIFKQDNHQMLCGFSDREQMALFTMLTEVQGVGTKSALSILSKLSNNDVVNAIKNQDSALLCVADGIGKKTAQRIISELNHKDLSFVQTKDIGGDNVNDAIMALVSLGYSRDEAYRMVGAAIDKIGKDSEANTIVTECLKSSL